MKILHKRFAALFLAAVLLVTGILPVEAAQNTAQEPGITESTGEPVNTDTDADDSAAAEEDASSAAAQEQTVQDPAAVQDSLLEQPTPESEAAQVSSQEQTVQDPTVSFQSESAPETPENTLEADFLYSELSEDETSRGVIIKLATDQELEQAVLTWQDENGISETKASHLIENYASFFLPASDSITYLSVASVAGQTSYTTDLSPLEEGNTLDYQQLAETENADIQNISEEEQEAAKENVITVSTDEEITKEDVAEAVTDTVSTMSVSPRSGTDTKVIVLDPGHGKAGSGTYRDWGDFVVDEAVINFKISQYTKEALEKNYSNVNVYLTKTTQNENPSISARVNYAVEKGADILVSQHVNSTSDSITTAHGVVAMVPKVDNDHPYHAETAKEAQELARDILDELVALGFNDMGFQMRLSGTGDTYEDGSLADYYGIVRYSRKANIPGVIIEHGFANNREDALKLNNENMLKQIGEADAKGIAAYLGLSAGSSGSTPTPTPAPTATPTPTPTPTPAPSGYTGWKQTGGNWYYFRNGQQTTGWQQVNGTWYYMNSSGVMLTGWQFIGNTWYYMNNSGAMLTGWQFIGGVWYYMDGSGHMLTGWQKIGNTWYYLNNSGTMLTGWQFIGNTWYYMNGSGAMLTGWQKIGNTWYYMSNSGAMLTGWQLVGNTWYYMNSSGAMLTGWQKLGNAWYYLNGSGAMLTGWQKLGNTWYYMNSSGAMLTGWQLIGNTWYYMNSSGAMLTGWQLIGNTWYYMNNSGAMLTGWQLIGGSWYYMNGSGAMLTGWQRINGTWYYLDDSGRMAANTWVGSYYVNGSGAWLQTSGNSGSSAGTMIAIDAGHQRKGDNSKEPMGPGSSVMKAKVATGTYGKWSGLNEYELTLQVAQKLQAELVARGYEVYMVRDSHDVNISNAQRAQNAAAAGADLLVRIHANGDNNSSVYGALTMAPSNSNTFLSDSLIASSQKLSQKIVDGLCASTGTKNRGVMTTDTMSGINWSTIPVTIVEMGFMTNQTEDLNMASVSYQQKIAEGIANGIDQYCA